MKTISSQKEMAQQRVFFIKTAADTFSGNGVIASQIREYEDDFAGLVALQKEGLIEPPFDFTELEKLGQMNNILAPLIEAMETNIDGTGWEIVSKASKEDEEETADQSKTQIEAFFDEVWPGKSFLTVRKEVRRDLELTGNGYIEVLRNLKGDVIFLRAIDAKTVRLLRLDDAVPVTKTLSRGGSERSITVQMRERRFVQIVGGKPVYFKEFGASRKIDKRTGRWEGTTTGQDGDKLLIDPAHYGTEILHFRMKEDIGTPYGIPRWISNAPSVVGSRKAEEFNMEFFDAGGVPPLLIIVSGGQLAENAEKALREHFMARGSQRHQAAVMEAFSTSGDVDSPQNVRVTVERFGAERQQDSMFENYIEKCDQRVRRAFRLPPIFLGMSEDFSFATAFASYTVAEAQVFQPERLEFDETINLLLMPELPRGNEFIFRSLPLQVKDATQQLKALEMAQSLMDPEDWLNETNTVVNLNLRASEGAPRPGEIDAKTQAEIDAMAARATAGLVTPVEEGARNPPQKGSAGGIVEEKQRTSNTPVGNPKVSKSDMLGLHELAKDAASATREGAMLPGGRAKLRAVNKAVDELKPDEVATFRALLTLEMFPELQHDPAGSAEIAWHVFKASQHGQA